MNEHDLDLPPVSPRTRHQLGILVLDGSGSMNETTAAKIKKAEAVHVAVQELLGELKKSRVKKNFSIAVVTFDTAAVVHTPETPVWQSADKQINDYGDFNPLTGHGGGTNIEEGLRCAQGIAQLFLSQTNGESVPRSVVIVLMSDGGANEGDAISVANALKSITDITICTTLFSAVGEDIAKDKELMQNIATSPSEPHYRTTYEAEDLRKFFIASMSASKNVKIG